MLRQRASWRLVPLRGRARASAPISCLTTHTHSSWCALLSRRVALCRVKSLGAPQVSPGDTIADVVDDSYVVAARAFDAAILNATQRGVRQVVALGHGGDTRGYRLGWPPGVRCFELAPFDAVAHAELAFTRAGVKPARGTLVRRVAADVSGPGARGAGWTERLQQAGFSANLPSVWALQGLHLLPDDALTALTVEAGDCAALHSEVVGEVSVDAMQRHFGALLADAGFQLEQWATLQEVGAELGRTLGPDAAQRAVFHAIKSRLTGVEHDTLRAEIDRAEYETGEEGFNDMP